MKVDMLLRSGATRFRSGVKAVMISYSGQRIVMLMPDGERISEDHPTQVHVIVEEEDTDGQVEHQGQHLLPGGGGGDHSEP